MILLICLVIILAVIPFVIEARRQTMTPEMQKNADGKFAKLSAGLTHYRWAGGTRGPVIVAVHGLTTPSIVWDALIPALTKLGFRVLSYDLYGRGFSAAPRGAQSLDFFMQQLDELLIDQGVTDDVTLMGYSMGGSIVTGYAAMQSHRIARVLLVAPAGIKMTELPFDRFCRMVPLLGDWAHGMFAAKRARGGSVRPEAIAKMQKFQLNRRGYLPGILASRRGALNTILEDAHRSLGDDDVPVWAFWGREDAVIPLSAMGVLAAWNRDARQDDIVGADHSLPYSQPDALAAAITAMLRDRT